jgi:SAM-dependent methyltransferase
MENSNNEIAAEWDHAHRFSPAPRYRRRIILNWLDKLKFTECLDVGCAQPYLLSEIVEKYNVKGYGCDISTKVIAKNKKLFPHYDFWVLDIEQENMTNHKQFDMVVSSEVVEHIPNWKIAIKNLAHLSQRYLLITVPCGKIRPIDRMVGHRQHFAGPEIKAEIEKNGFKCIKVSKHGFPVHSLYKRLINISPDTLYHSFQETKKYSFWQQCISHLLYIAFYVNDLFSSGEQLMILAQREDVITSSEVL